MKVSSCWFLSVFSRFLKRGLLFMQTLNLLSRLRVIPKGKPAHSPISEIKPCWAGLFLDGWPSRNNQKYPVCLVPWLRSMVKRDVLQFIGLIVWGSLVIVGSMRTKSHSAPETSFLCPLFSCHTTFYRTASAGDEAVVKPIKWGKDPSLYQGLCFKELC